jgi:glycerophosphoryl diester phosphodiesterase
MTPALVRSLHTAGQRALCYTVNDPSVAAWLLDAGVDGLITDAVDRFAPGA